MEKPFVLTADYSGMGFESLLVPNAGESGDVKTQAAAREKAVAMGCRIAQE